MRTFWRDDVPQTTNPLRFFLFVSKPHLRYAILASCFVVVASVLRTLIPYVYKMIVDAAVAIGTGQYTAVWVAVALYIGLTLGSNLLWRLSGFTGAEWATGVRATARGALSSYVTLHSQQYFSDRFAGSLASKIKQAGDSMREFVEAYLWQFLSFFISVISSTVIVFIESPIVGFLLLGLFAVITPANIYFAHKRVPLSVATQDAETKLNGAVVDTLTNMPAVHEFARRGFELERLRTFIMRRRDTGLRSWQFGEWTLLGNNIVQSIFTGAMMVAALLLAIRGVLSPGDIVLFLAMVALLEDQLMFIGSQLNSVAESWGTVTESLTDIIRPHEVTDLQESNVLVATGGAVTFEDVSFGYGGTTIFSNLSFTVPAGQKVGVVGRSGAGKSTLMKLILRHYDLDSGCIRIDGTDIARVRKESLRDAVAIVPQEPALFHRTIAENIAYGRPDASDADIVQVAGLAQAHAFIDALPNKYQTLVGERGVKLSGGQRQRIAIARALLKDAPLLLLDEATSALDSESEAAIQEALLVLMEGRTVLAIAHRLSTLRAMDRLLVFDEGRIIEDGTHEELMKRHGLYADLWKHQAGGFVE